MNNVISAAMEDYKPEHYKCVNVPISVLRRIFRFTPTEAEIVHQLLRECKYDVHEINGSRQYIFYIRKKLKIISDKPVQSWGMEFYAIPDEVKEKIVKYILDRPGTSATISTNKS